jgi:K+-transporting ATPase KdpF subunit
MAPLYLVAGLIVLGLLVYLFAALVKPEWFG